MGFKRAGFFFLVLSAIFYVFAYASCAGVPEQKAESGEDGDDLDLELSTENLPVNSFKEIWAYVSEGQESALRPSLSVSDAVYFASEVDRYGNLTEAPKRSKLGKFAGRVHISAACSSAALNHFIIEPGSKTRSKLLKDLVGISKDFDGLNIDFEGVPAKDSDNFLSFLRELGRMLDKDKIFSVCVPGRTQADTVYNYEKIAPLVDRVFVMAYDEHWSGSSPGPVASMKWCRNVAAYALKTIGSEKLVMGMPFYGRSWGDVSTSRALIHSTTNNLKKEHGVDSVKRVNGIPTFTYDVTVRVTVYYEDEVSIAARGDMYKKQGVLNIGFWRLGQETKAVWQAVNIE